MTVDYVLTLEDFSEARLAHQQAVRKGSVRVWPFILSAAVVYLLPVVLEHIPASGFDSLAATMSAALPYAVIVAGLISIMSNARRVGSQPIRTYVLKSLPNRSIRRPLTLAVLVCGLITLLFYLKHLLQQPTTVAGPIPKQDAVWLLSDLPWIAIAGVFIFSTRMHNAGGAKRSWEQQPGLHRPHSAQLVADGVTVATSMQRTELKWDAFVATGETPNLFLLYLSSVGYVIVPKRAFATSGDVDAFRNMLAHFIGTRESAFPVEMAAPSTST